MQIPLFPHVLEADGPPLSAEQALYVLRDLEKALLEDMDEGLRAANRGCAVTTEEGGGVNAQSHACLVNSSIQARLQRRWHGNDLISVLGGLGVRVRTGGLSFAVKKMVGGWFSFNDTEKACSDLRQANGPFLIVGYSLDYTGTQIREVRLVLPRNEKEAWWDVAFDVDLSLPEDFVAPAQVIDPAPHAAPQRGRNRIRAKGETGEKEQKSNAEPDGKA